MKFISILYGLISIVFAFIAVLGFLSTYLHPEEYERFVFFGLILLPVLANGENFHQRVRQADTIRQSRIPIATSKAI